MIRVLHPNPICLVSLQEKDRNTHREEEAGELEAEMRLIRLPAKKHQGLTATIRNWKRQAGILPRVSEGAWPQ